ncbi:MAG: hypothetical protein LBM92_01245, partial [Opitutaceae bacterium]|nr:hypothetical protein [Opitutaceae bacterium]
SRTPDSITLATITGAEYARAAAGPWQTSPTFSGLTPGASHTFHARMAASATHDASPASGPAEFATAPQLYALAVNAGAGGGVAGTPSGDYAEGAPVIVTATPAAKHAFAGWTASGVALTAGQLSAATLSLAMPAGPVALTAKFAATGGSAAVELSALGGVDSAGNGWTFSAVAGVLTLLHGANVTLTGSNASIRVAVFPGATAGLALDGATIDNPGTGGPDVLTIGENAKLTLTLAGSSALKGRESGAGSAAVRGVFCEAGAELAINGPGSLALDSMEGGDDTIIEINSGAVTVAQRINTPGENDASPILRINGGTVSAGAGIHGIVAVNGDAVVFSGEPLPASAAKTKGVIFEGSTGAVHGSPRLPTNTEIPAGKTLAIATGRTLTIGAGVTLNNQGAIQNNGRLVVETGGALTGNAVQGNAPEYGLPPTQPLTVSAGAGGTTSAPGASHAPGASVTVTAYPNSGYTFAAWTSAGVTLTPAQKTSATLTFPMPPNAVALTASFTATSTGSGGSGGSSGGGGGGAPSWVFLAAVMLLAALKKRMRA